MGKDSGSAPSAPNYSQLAQQQAAAQNAASAQNLAASRVNQYGPYGNIVWGTDANGSPSLTTTLNPTSQKIFDLGQNSSLGLSQMSNGMLGRVANSYGFNADKKSVANGTWGQADEDLLNSLYGRLNSVSDGGKSGMSYDQWLSIVDSGQMPGFNGNIRIQDGYNENKYITAYLNSGYNPQSNSSSSDVQKQIDDLLARKGAAGQYHDEWSFTDNGTPQDINSIVRQQLGEDLTHSADFSENGIKQYYQNILDRDQSNMDRAYNQKVQQLANQGITYGSEAYNKAMDDYNRGINDFKLGAQNNAVGQAINLGNAKNVTRANQIAQALAERNRPLMELNALQGKTTVPAYVNTGSAAQYTAPNLMGAAQAQYGADLNAYNANQAQNSSMMNGLFSLGSLGLNAYTSGLFGGLGSALGGSSGGGFFGPSAFSDASGLW